METTYFYDTFLRLCKEKGEKPSAVVTKIGLSTPNATYWKRGSIPKYETIKKIAEYFSVPVETFLDLSPDEKAKIEMSSLLVKQLIAEVGDSNAVNMDEVRSRMVDIALSDRSTTREIGPYEQADKIILDAYANTTNEELDEKLLELYHRLNRRGRIEALDRLLELSSSIRYSLQSYIDAFYADFERRKWPPQDPDDPETADSNIQK